MKSSESRDFAVGDRVRFAVQGVGTDRIGTYLGMNNAGQAIVRWKGEDEARPCLLANLLRVGTVERHGFRF